jgi:hypothetical protein
MDFPIYVHDDNGFNCNIASEFSVNYTKNYVLQRSCHLRNRGSYNTSRERSQYPTRPDWTFKMETHGCVIINFKSCVVKIKTTKFHRRGQEWFKRPILIAEFTSKSPQKQGQKVSLRPRTTSKVQHWVVTFAKNDEQRQKMTCRSPGKGNEVVSVRSPKGAQKDEKSIQKWSKRRDATR